MQKIKFLLSYRAELSIPARKTKKQFLGNKNSHQWLSVDNQENLGTNAAALGTCMMSMDNHDGKC